MNETLERDLTKLPRWAQHEIAGLIARLRAALNAARIQHNYCEDSWYSCPKAPDGCADDRVDQATCNCGADAHNAAIDAALRSIKTM